MNNFVRQSTSIAMVLLLLGAMLGALCGNANAADPQIERGKYLVSVLPCTDCHTPGTFLGKPDMTRYLGGSEVGFEVPGLGVFYEARTNPDKETGLGNWTMEMCDCDPLPVRGRWSRPRSAYASRVVQEPFTRWFGCARLIAAYLKTLPPIKNKVPGPFGASEKPTSFVYQVLPPNKYLPTPPPGAGK